MISKIIELCARNKLVVMIGLITVIWTGIEAIRTIPLDAIPDVSEPQVVIYVKWMQSPNILENQVAYPIVHALLGAPRVKTVRAISTYGYTYVYVIFKEGTNIYWARSRVLEYLSNIERNLPHGIKIELGPDASGIGWVYEYALIDKTGQHNLEQLTTYQNWNLKYVLQSLPGVAEVATVGGMVKEFQVQVNPNALAAYHLRMSEVVHAIQTSNQEVGGGILELHGTEFMVQSQGYIHTVHDLEDIAVGRDAQGVPILIRDIGQVAWVPDERRGIADLNGEGGVVGGIVTARYGANAFKVIQEVKHRIAQIHLPPGVQLVTVYDQAQLIKKSIHTLTSELIKLGIIVSLVCLIFLWNMTSSLIIIFTLPVAILMSFIGMNFIGVTANIMSLGGIAIALGTMVDASIIMVENTVKRLSEWKEESSQESRESVILRSVKEVGPSLFFTLLVMTVGFLPVFALRGQEGKLFAPLAYTKTFSLFFAAILAITVTPLLMIGLLKGKIPLENKQPLNMKLRQWYAPWVRWGMDHRGMVIFLSVVMMAVVIPLGSQLGNELMPPLWEGTLLYMPSTLPGISEPEAILQLQNMDRVIRSFPEVKTVFGKAGKANTALDPASLSMVETTITLKPRKTWPHHITPNQLIAQMNQKLQVPGDLNDWTMPIINRIDMLTTGLTTPIGIKVYGNNLKKIQTEALQIQKALDRLPQTISAFAEQTLDGHYVNIRPIQSQLARYGMTEKELNEAIATDIGGEKISTAILGRERFPISARFELGFRDTLHQLRRILLITPSGQYIQLGQVAQISTSHGPDMIRDEEGKLVSYITIDIHGTDFFAYIHKANQMIQKKVRPLPGVGYYWAGDYQTMRRTDRQLVKIIPLTVLVIFVLIFVSTRSVVQTSLILLTIPFSLIGAVGLLLFLKYKLSVAVWVGIIALSGLDVETGVVMLLYLNLAYQQYQSKGQMNSLSDLKEATFAGAVQRLRPKLMTVCAAFFGLVPILFSHGTGSSIMKRIATPMIGGVFTSFALELLVFPAFFVFWKWNTEVKKQATHQPLRGFWKIIQKLG